MDQLYDRIQPHARAIGKVATVDGVKGIDDMYILNFAEESIRGHPLYYLSPILQKLQMQARECAGLSPWQTVSNVEEGVTGVVKVSVFSFSEWDRVLTLQSHSSAHERCAGTCRWRTWRISRARKWRRRRC